MAHDRQPEKYQNKRPSDPSHPDELRQLTMSESKPKKGKSNCFSISSISFALQSFSLLFIGSFILSICSSVYQSVYWYPSPSYPILPCPILSQSTLSYPIISYPSPSYPTLSYPIPGHLILSYHILSQSILSYPNLSYPTPSYPSLSYPSPPYPILSYPIPVYPILSQSNLSYPIPVHPILPCPTLSYPSPSYPTLSYPIPVHPILPCPFPVHFLPIPSPSPLPLNSPTVLEHLELQLELPSHCCSVEPRFFQQKMTAHIPIS